jgi:hypothetical protein
MPPDDEFVPKPCFAIWRLHEMGPVPIALSNDFQNVIH